MKYTMLFYVAGDPEGGGWHRDEVRMPALTSLELISCVKGRHRKI